jgi:iron complex transport system ATP-binding protein
VLHDWNLALRVADEVLVLHDGRIAAFGAPEAILTPELFRSVFAVQVDILDGPDGSPVVVARPPAATGGHATGSA